MSKLLRRGIIQAYESGFKRQKTFAYLKQLERSQWLSRDELSAMQFESLRRLTTYAFEHCPYYCEAWRSRGLDPADLKHAEDFARWPILHRETISENRMQMRSDAVSRFISKSTGGSSGVPLAFEYDLGSEERRKAATYRGYAWAGAGPGTRQLYFWGGALGKRSWAAVLKDSVYQTIYNRRVINSLQFDDTKVPGILESIKSYRPDVIVAYVNPLYQLSRAAEEQGLIGYAPRSIVVGAEKLHEFQRAQIERTFKAPVFETYGSREFMLIGAECEQHQGLHLTAEHLLVEVVDEHGAAVGAGEEGNVVVTDLFNYGMPFIRYLNGDRAVAGAETCSCGRSLPILKKIVGRQIDVIRTPDGRNVAGELFPHLLKDYPAVRRFRVVQDECDHVKVEIVPSPAFTDRDEAQIREVVQHVMGSTMRIDVLRVNAIPLTKAGKYRVVENEWSSRGAAMANV